MTKILRFMLGAFYCVQAAAGYLGLLREPRAAGEPSHSSGGSYVARAVGIAAPGWNKKEPRSHGAHGKPFPHDMRGRAILHIPKHIRIHRLYLPP